MLEAAGYEVRLAGLKCCGRPAISKGLLKLGRDLARENVERLLPLVRQGLPILGCEPSCLVTLVDEYRDFRLGPAADEVARACSLVEAFVADRDRVPELDLQPLAGRVLFHGHCQQKAVVGTAGTVAALRRIPGIEVHELDSGCCGMAGSFGYEHGHYDVSKALADRVLIPAASADPGGPPGRPRLLLPQPGARPGGDQRGASDPAPGRADRRDEASPLGARRGLDAGRRRPGIASDREGHMGIR